MKSMSQGSQMSEYFDSLPINEWETLHQSVCVERPQDYSYYQQLSIKWGNQDNYQLIQKLGRGKYSEVYEAACLKNNQKCVVKILKPVRTEKIYREIKILQTLFGGPNIVKMFDVTRDSSSKIPSLVYEYIPNIESKVLFRDLTDKDVRIYMYKLLEALDYSHSQGIMHRDVKPLNIVINHEKQDLRLIDWGLADFYNPGQEYNVRVASRYYKGPELLVEDKLYHYSLDIWSLGCTFATMMLRIDPFFKGSDNNDQLIKIAKVMGTEDLKDYLRKYKLNLPNPIAKVMKNYPKLELEAFITKENKALANELAMDLLKRMLVYDKNGRITPVDAMQHPTEEIQGQLQSLTLSKEKGPATKKIKHIEQKQEETKLNQRQSKKRKFDCINVQGDNASKKKFKPNDFTASSISKKRQPAKKEAQLTQEEKILLQIKIARQQFRKVQKFRWDFYDKYIRRRLQDQQKSPQEKQKIKQLVRSATPQSKYYDQIENGFEEMEFFPEVRSYSEQRNDKDQVGEEEQEEQKESEAAEENEENNQNIDVDDLVQARRKAGRPKKRKLFFQKFEAEKLALEMLAIYKEWGCDIQ
eukprot:403352081